MFWCGVLYCGYVLDLYLDIFTLVIHLLLFALLLTAVFVAAMALFPATKGYVLNSIAPGPSWHKILLGFPILWACWEWLRTVVFTGLPWDLLGYSQTTTWLGATAPYMSVYAVSFTVVLLSSVFGYSPKQTISTDKNNSFATSSAYNCHMFFSKYTLFSSYKITR